MRMEVHTLTDTEYKASGQLRDEITQAMLRRIEDLPAICQASVLLNVVAGIVNIHCHVTGATELEMLDWCRVAIKEHMVHNRPGTDRAVAAILGERDGQVRPLCKGGEG